MQVEDSLSKQREEFDFKCAEARCLELSLMKLEDERSQKFREFLIREEEQR